MHKDFPIHDAMHFIVRGEFFNIWNHAQFANPVSGVSDATFGKITSTHKKTRIAQLGATLSF